MKESSSGGTVLSYEYGADVGGRVAAFGQRMLDGVVSVLLAGFFDRLRAHLQGESGGGFFVRVRGWIALARMFWGRK